MKRCDPATCEENPQNGSRIYHRGFADCGGSCANCENFFLVRQVFRPVQEDLSSEAKRLEIRKSQIEINKDIS